MSASGIKVTAFVRTPDGECYEYRLVSSRLERRQSYSQFWQTVTGEMFLCMSPAELRHVANVLERVPPSPTDEART